MGIPGDHVNRVETYHHPLELAAVRELQSRGRLPTDEGTVQSERVAAVVDAKVIQGNLMRISGGFICVIGSSN
jgi:hypothetical protein